MQVYAKRNTSPCPLWPVRHIGLLPLLLVVMLAIATTKGNAQSPSGTILGTVTDSTGAVLGNTTIQLINSATGAKTTAVSNDSGYYQFADVTRETTRSLCRSKASSSCPGRTLCWRQKRESRLIFR